MNETIASRRTLFASVGALASMLAALSCCVPLLPFVAAAGAAGSSAFFSSMRPYLLLASAALIAFGFYQAHRARQCKSRPNRLSTILLWCSAAIVFVSVFFPQALAELVAG